MDTLHSIIRVKGIDYKVAASVVGDGCAIRHDMRDILLHWDLFCGVREVARRGKCGLIIGPDRVADILE